MAPLVVAVVVVLGFGMASVVLEVGAHAPPTAKSETKAQPNLPNTAALTALLHSPGAVGPGAHGKPSGVKAGIITEKTTNWAGYADVANSPGTITSVFSEWYVPTATCGETSGPAYEAQWVGIDGLVSASVEQAGSLDYCSGPGATPQYYTWWEFYPFNSIQLYASTTPGAVISVYILYNPSESVNGVYGVYAVELFDVDNGVNFIETMGGWNLGYTPADSSAECISEAPYVGVQVAKLANYGTTTFYNCYDTIGTHTTGIGSQGGVSTIYKINQVQNQLDQATGLLSGLMYPHDTFSIKWKAYH